MREQHYLRDMLTLLLERARNARDKAAELRHNRSADLQEREFAAGRAQAYYEVLSTFVNQLDAFGISRASLGLAEDLNLDRELL